MAASPSGCNWICIHTASRLDPMKRKKLVRHTGPTPLFGPVRRARQPGRTLTPMRAAAIALLDRVLESANDGDDDLCTLFRLCVVEADQLAQQELVEDGGDDVSLEETRAAATEEEAAQRAAAKAKAKAQRAEAKARKAEAAVAAAKAKQQAIIEAAKAAEKAAKAQRELAKSAAKTQRDAERTAADKAREAAERAAAEARARDEARLREEAEARARLQHAEQQELEQLTSEAATAAEEEKRTSSSTATNITKERLQRGTRRLSFLGGGGGGGGGSSGSKKNKPPKVEEFEVDLETTVGKVVAADGAGREQRQAALKKAEVERRRSTSSLDLQRFRRLLPPGAREVISEEDWRSFKGWMRLQAFYSDDLDMEDYVESFDEWSSSDEYLELVDERRLVAQRRLDHGEWQDEAEFVELSESTQALTAWLASRGWALVPPR